MATGVYVLQDGSVMVAYGPRHIPISCAQYKANGYKDARADRRQLASSPFGQHRLPSRDTLDAMYGLRRHAHGLRDDGRS